ncbi:Pentatricopeptide repeat [Macleaya cordata]|uniref:Pentatricopeptide repeat n=1 Tax=Macleaya cordata TaxID=56857 RepID=A0A200Q8C6_MACCD|nr:Pentatricopeptide repeat [Macleaya cordata]
MSVECLGALLQSCMKSKALKPGKQIHAQLLTTGTETKPGSLSSKLVGVYAGCGDGRSAKKIFESMQKPTVFAWNWMISASAFQGDCEGAVNYFSQMQKAGIFPNKFTFSCVLKACVGLMDIMKGKELHCLIYKVGFESDVSVMNALIDMYCKCGKLDFARKLFDEMSERDVATWTSMMCGYSHKGELENSLKLLERMKSQGLEPNEFTWNAVITGFAQNGDCNGAFELFCKMKTGGLKPDLVTWNSMISGFTQNHQSEEALMLFRDMLVSGLHPNSVTIAGLLPACGFTGSLNRGKEIHGLIYRRELGMNIFMITALIDMYSKCGSVNYASNVFDQTCIPIPNVAAWNAMIGCYGKHGLVEASIQLLERMQEEGVNPNQVTFTCVLSACSHGGLVEKGLEIFMSMKENCRVELSKEHYSCIIDLLCRSGRVAEAYELVKEMGEGVNDSIIGAFLNGCRIHGRSDLAKVMAEEVLRMDLKKPGGFVTLSNIYAADGEWEWVESVRKVMKEKGVYKKAGLSWVEKKEGLLDSK